MKQYLELVRAILDTGTWQENRTGIRTISMPGAMLRFDLQQGFPAVTTKKLAFKSAIGEMVGFLRASKNAADFRALGCKVWDANANENPQWLANPYRAGPRRPRRRVRRAMAQVAGVQGASTQARATVSPMPPIAAIRS